MAHPLHLTLLCTLLTTGAVAQDTPTRGTDDPHKRADGSWIGVSGTVASTSPGAFVLDYGDGTIKVELEPSSTKQHDFIQDEQVRVYGVVDAGLFKGKTIQARAVYVESMKTYACTTEGSEAICAAFAPVIYSGVVVHGRVSAVKTGSLTLDEGDRMVEVDTKAMSNPTGAPTASDPKVGDLVTVVGHMDEGFFSRKLKADSVEIVK